jgi:Mg2+/Co2+ transporter CorC
MDAINKVYQIIKEYRKEEGEYMSEQVIKDWIAQFEEADRDFILDQMANILSKRYITRDRFKEYLRSTFFKDIIRLMQSDFKMSDIKEIFKRSYFISGQPEGRSQKVVLKIFAEVLEEELGLKIDECGKGDPVCCIYLDDIYALATPYLRR